MSERLEPVQQNASGLDGTSVVDEGEVRRAMDEFGGFLRDTTSVSLLAFPDAKQAGAVIPKRSSNVPVIALMNFDGSGFTMEPNKSHAGDDVVRIESNNSNGTPQRVEFPEQMFAGTRLYGGKNNERTLVKGGDEIRFLDRPSMLVNGHVVLAAAIGAEGVASFLQDLAVVYGRLRGGVHGDGEPESVRLENILALNARVVDSVLRVDPENLDKYAGRKSLQLASIVANARILSKIGRGYSPESIAASESMAEYRKMPEDIRYSAQEALADSMLRHMTGFFKVLRSARAAKKIWFD